MRRLPTRNSSAPVFSAQLQPLSRGTILLRLEVVPRVPTGKFFLWRGGPVLTLSARSIPGPGRAVALQLCGTRAVHARHAGQHGSTGLPPRILQFRLGPNQVRPVPCREVLHFQRRHSVYSVPRGAIQGQRWRRFVLVLRSRDVFQQSRGDCLLSLPSRPVCRALLGRVRQLPRRYFFWTSPLGRRRARGGRRGGRGAGGR